MKKLFRSKCINNQHSFTKRYDFKRSVLGDFTSTTSRIWHILVVCLRQVSQILHIHWLADLFAR